MSFYVSIDKCQNGSFYNFLDSPTGFIARTSAYASKEGGPELTDLLQLASPGMQDLMNQLVPEMGGQS